MRLYIPITIVGLILVGAIVILSLRVAGLGDEVGNFVFGSQEDPTPTRTPRPPHPTPEPLPSNSDISFEFRPEFTNCDFSLSVLDCNRTSTGAVAFDATVENESDCRIYDVEVKLTLNDGNGELIRELTEPIRSLGPRDRGSVSMVAPSPESLGWELYDSFVSWQWDC